MKKKMKILTFSILGVLLISVSHKVIGVTLDTKNPEIKTEKKVVNNKEIVYSENKTIQQLVTSLKGKSQDYINQYLNGEDSQRIIAFPNGGYGMSSDPKNPGIIGTVTNYNNGETTTMDSRSKDSATIGEVKEVLSLIN